MSFFFFFFITVSLLLVRELVTLKQAFQEQGTKKQTNKRTFHLVRGDHEVHPADAAGLIWEKTAIHLGALHDWRPGDAVPGEQVAC